MLRWSKRLRAVPMLRHCFQFTAGRRSLQRIAEEDILSGIEQIFHSYFCVVVVSRAPVLYFDVKNVSQFLRFLAVSVVALHLACFEHVIGSGKLSVLSTQKKLYVD